MIANKESEVANSTDAEPLVYPKNLGLSLLFVISGYNIFYYGTSFGIGRGLFYVSLILATLISLHKKRGVVAYIIAAVGITAGLLIGFRANGFVQGFNFAIANLAFVVLLLIHATNDIRWTIWSIFSLVSQLIGKSFVQPLTILLGSRKISEVVSQFKKVFSLLKTTVITFIVVYLFAAILSRADPIFSQLVDTFLRQSFGRITFSLLLASTITIWLTIKLKDQKEGEPTIGFLSIQDIAASVSGIIVIFAVFLAIQIRYLFATHEVFQTFGLTYSQYVRKGFFELLVATTIGAIISYIVLLKKRVYNGNPVYLLFLNVGLMIELIFLLASALRRDLMYIEVYGLTRTRIIGEIFLFWLLGSLFLLLILNIWKKMHEKWAVSGIGVLTLGALLYINLINMDEQIVRAAPIRHEQRDIFYITNLSEDVFAGWEEAVTFAKYRWFNVITQKPELTDTEKAHLANIKLAMVTLRFQRERLEKKYGEYNIVKEKYIEKISDEYQKKRTKQQIEKDRAWQAYNLTEHKAWQEMQGKKDLFYSDVDNLIGQIEVYQKINKIDLFALEQWILYDFEYPFVGIVDYHPIYIPLNPPSEGSPPNFSDQQEVPIVTPVNENLYR